MAHWSFLDPAERTRLEDLIRILLVDKYWEATHGFELTEEIRVLISGMAGLLILGLEYDDYHRVTSIIVSPTKMVLQGDRAVGEAIMTNEPLAIIGLAQHNGPVVIAWDSAREQARHPEHGHNVVYHEFAHKLDMLDGSADGAPPMETQEERERWIAVCTEEFNALREGNGGHLLDPYGATNPGEFFAVITEVFFDRPTELQQHKPELYQVLQAFYRQDPAARERRPRAAAD